MSDPNIIEPPVPVAAVAPQPTPLQAEGVREDSSADGQQHKKRRRGSRGGRGRKPASADGAQSRATADAATTDRRPDDMPDRPIEGRPPRIGDTRPAPRPVAPTASAPATKPQAASSAPGGGAKQKRKRGGRGRSGTGGAAGSAGGAPRAALDARDELAGIELDEETLERRRGRERNGRPVGRYLMCVHVREQATQIAVLEGRALIEHYVSRPQDDATQIDGNVYLGKVQNVLPGMEAAFIDIGTPKNAVLYRGDVRYDADDVDGPTGQGGGGRSDARIEQLLRPGQTILCQVTKNPIGTKGARLTQEVSMPGRFVVLIPNSSTYGISKRLPDDERKRLRRILDEVKPEHHGIIVRTAAEGTTAEELRRDVLRLLKQWEAIEALAKRSPTPSLLYREPDMAVRVIREEFNKEYRGVVIDDEALFHEVRDYVASISPELADRVEYYDPAEDPLPIFERHHIHEQLHKRSTARCGCPRADR